MAKQSVQVQGSNRNQAAPLDKITLQLPWKHQFEFAGFYAAREKGFYQRYGLEVEVKEYQLGLNITDEVLSGRAEYGLTNNILFMDRLQNKPVKLLANYFIRMPLVIISQLGTHSLEALKGRRLMIAEKDLQSPLVQLAFRAAGLKPGVNIKIVPHSFDTGPFIRNEVDAMTAFRSNEPYLLESKGVPFQLIDIASYLPVQGDSYLFTSEHETESNPQRAKNFLQATNEGWKYALKHPEEMVELILSQYSQHKSRGALLYEAEKIRQLMSPDTYPVGSTMKHRVHIIAETLLQGGFVQNLRHLNGFLFDTSSQQTRPTKLNKEELAWLQQHPKIRVANETDWPPFDFTIDNLPRGYSIDLLELAAAKVGLNLEYINGLTWDQLLQKGEARELDLFPAIWKTEQREQYLDFTTPYITTPHILVVRENETNIEGIDDLKGQIVAGVKGYADIGQLKKHFPEINILEVTNVSTGLRAVAYGQANAYLGTQGAVAYAIREGMIHNLKIATEITLNNHLSANEMHFATRNDWPLLTTILQKGLDAVTMQEHLTLQNRWISLPGTAPPTELILTEEEQQWLKQHPIIHVAFNPHWAPVEFADEAGNHQGISSDYLTHLEKLLHVQFEAVPAQAADIKRLIVDKKLEIIPTLNQTPDRAKYVDFTEPYLEIPVAIFSAKDIAYLSGLDALAGKKVAVVQDHAVHEWLQQDYPQLQFVPVSNLEEALQRVTQGEAYAFVGALIPTSYYIGKMGLTHIKIIGETPYKYALSMATRKDQPILTSILNKALQTIPQAERNSIFHKWTSIHYTKALDLTLLWQILVVAFIVLLIILYWNRRLASEVARSRQAEVKSKRAHQFLQGLTNAIGDGVIAMDDSGVCVFVNPAAESLLGWSQADLIGKNLHRMIHCTSSNGESHSEEACAILNSAEKGVPYRSEEEVFQHRDGLLFPISITAVPLTEHGKQGVIAVFQDISERKKSEQELRKLHMAVEQSPVNIIITDKKGNIEYVNPKFEQVTGYTKDDVIGKNPSILKSGFTLKETYSDLWKTITRGEIWSGELRNRKKNGDAFWEFASICPIKNDADEITHFIAVKEDISLLKLRENELRTATEAADNANQAKGEFLANMSHEIRTPMNAIIGMGHLLQNTDLSKEQQGYLFAVQSSASNLLGIINDILDFSKIEAGKLKIESIEFKLDDVLNKMMTLMEALAQEKGVKLTLALSSEIPVTLLGDPLRLSQILTNLVSNAIKFTLQGEVTINVEMLKRGRDNIQLQFMVEDTGIGINQEQLEKIFAPFTQADSSHTRSFGGTGLGLSISRQLVNMMAGKIWAESVVGKGSTFFCTLTFALTEEGNTTKSSTRNITAQQSPVTLEGFHVLLVEDDKINQIIAQKLLESYGVTVTTVDNGEEAVEAVKQQPFGLVLMDIQMPQMNGYQATAEIRKDQHFKNLPIIAMTAHAMVGVHGKCIAAGMDGHLPKPFEPDTLKQLLIHWLLEKRTEEN
ncbi:MAG: transporter substrate-binding domain-containing protein [Candidatus Polarisedimenticolaceae bacterium]|nr:transporter substrate-binding domain-containing protein [Candidatus Polarisedimenticolaceae bacterium]